MTPTGVSTIHFSFEERLEIGSVLRAAASSEIGVQWDNLSSARNTLSFKAQNSLVCSDQGIRIGYGAVWLIFSCLKRLRACLASPKRWRFSSALKAGFKS
jgi:hypothetical protein